MPIDYKDILLPLAIKAGKEIMNYYKTNTETHYKVDNSPVTIADTSANKIIIDGLNCTNLPIISEESKNAKFSERESFKKYWLVDPLDGTKQFIRNEDQFTVNIALIENNLAVEGVIYAPALKILYYGNYKTNKAIKIDYNKENPEEIILNEIISKKDKLRIVVSKSHLNSDTKEVVDKIKKSFPDCEIINCGSSLKICKIAERDADLYLRKGSISEWDIAAGHAILKASGGNFIDMHSRKELVYNTKTMFTPDFYAYNDSLLLNDIISSL